ncbi:bifunctional (p)ppGpp synthetase/guanosine-3',5'-bis(diphosphate) 3'-pyrophosphohydrolase [Niveibacterium sp. SC-1]|uniref:RelA/SpoT family protein n=1 Tax=Niveibacterium sp. SC-1 TaxID=3135646 RepID=UPI0031204472
MVQVTHALDSAAEAMPTVEQLAEGLGEEAHPAIQAALDFALPLYGDRLLGTGEPVIRHAMGMVLIAVSLRLDLETRLAAILFDVADCLEESEAFEQVETRFGRQAQRLVVGLHRLHSLRMVTRKAAESEIPEVRAQTEVLRKMVLAMVEDLRVVMLRLASRVQTLRFLTENEGNEREAVARESMDLYAPLANRLGIWQLKWELEDLSFRFLEPQTYKRIAKMLDERRVEREAFITDAVERLRNELATAGVEAEVYGRPKHIYSIYNKMRAKNLDFAQVYDVRALRVLVKDMRDCYTALGIVHALWQPIPGEYDDYISKPKGNNYQSLHTAVRATDGRALEVQIRTHKMHRHAELGVAAHWRYKEGADASGGKYDEKIALLRQLLSWRDEITDSAQWESHFKRASLDDTIYVMTPLGRVIDLPQGATPIDFAYRVHSDLGHRCRGAKVNGQMVSLNTALENGQVVEIIVAKQGGPSRDWLNPQLGYLTTSNARSKVRRWFLLQEEAETLAQGRAIVLRELQRENQAHSSIDELANRLGYRNTDGFLIAVGRGDVGTRQIQIALHGSEVVDPVPDLVIGRSRANRKDDKILIVGVGRLLTTLAKCCKPAPPDPIRGFVTRGKGVSIHRADCRDFGHVALRHPERVVAAEWGAQQQAEETRSDVYPVDLAVEAGDRQGLLRDISEILSREKLNVVAVNTMSKSGRAFMKFTVEVRNASQVQRAVNLIGELSGVEKARRA